MKETSEVMSFGDDVLDAEYPLPVPPPQPAI